MNGQRMASRRGEDAGRNTTKAREAHKGKGDQMEEREKTKVSFEKGTLVAARFEGCNWNVEDVGVVLDARDALSGDPHITVVTERGVLVSMRQSKAIFIFHVLGEKADSMFVQMYALMSHWQAEEDHESGHFNDAYMKARALLNAESTIRRASLKSTFVGH